MALEHLNPVDEKVLVFIAGLLPTEAERALAEEHGTRAFRSAANLENCYPIERHRYAVAVDPALLPDGYTPYGVVEQAPPPPPVANPAQPAKRTPKKQSSPVISGEDGL